MAIMPKFLIKTPLERWIHRITHSLLNSISLLKGNALFKIKEYKKALDCYDKAIELKPKGFKLSLNSFNNIKNEPVFMLFFQNQFFIVTKRIV